MDGGEVEGEDDDDDDVDYSYGDHDDGEEVDKAKDLDPSRALGKGQLGWRRLGARRR